MNRNITSANSSAVLTVDELYPQGFFLEMFTTDQAYNMEPQTIAEDHMGVDGYLTAGYVPNPYVVTFAFEASSPSMRPLNYYRQMCIQGRRLYNCALVITQPSLARTLNFKTGILRVGAFASNAQRVLSSSTFTFVFERLDISERGYPVNWTPLF